MFSFSYGSHIILESHNQDSFHYFNRSLPLSLLSVSLLSEYEVVSAEFPSLFLLDSRLSCKTGVKRLYFM